MRAKYVCLCVAFKIYISFSFDCRVKCGHLFVKNSLIYPERMEKCFALNIYLILTKLVFSPE